MLLLQNTHTIHIQTVCSIIVIILLCATLFPCKWRKLDQCPTGWSSMCRTEYGCCTAYIKCSGYWGKVRQGLVEFPIGLTLPNWKYLEGWPLDRRAWSLNSWMSNCLDKQSTKIPRYNACLLAPHCTEVDLALLLNLAGCPELARCIFLAGCDGPEKVAGGLLGPNW